MRVRNECHLIRHDLKDKVHETRNRVSLYVELGLDCRSDGSHVRVPDVPFVRPRMDGYPFRAESLTVCRGFLHVGHVPAARIADGRYLVDVHTESGHVRSHCITQK